MKNRKKQETEFLPGNLDPSFVNLKVKNEATVITWQQYYQLVTSDPAVRENTLAARRTLTDGQEQSYTLMKAHCGAVTPSCQLNGGWKAEHVVGLTGVAMVDLDHIDPLRMAEVCQLVAADHHTFMMHVTCSGHGLRILARYQVEGEGPFVFLDAWQVVNQYYAMLTSCPYDTATKNVNRLSYLSHDPAAVFHPESIPFVVRSSSATARLRLQVNESQSQARTLPDLMAEAEELSRQAGYCWVEGHRHEMMLDLCRLHNKMGISAADSVAYLALRAPRGESEAQSLVHWVYTTLAADHASWRTKNRHQGVPAPAPDKTPIAEDESPEKGKKRTRADNRESSVARYTEVGEWLVANHSLRHNLVRNSLEYFDPAANIFRPLTEVMRNTMMIECDAALGKRVRASDFDAVLNSSFVPGYNPLAEYLGSLPAWDPDTDPDYIAELCATVHTTSDPDFFCHYFKKWFVALLPSMLEYDQTNQMVMVFCGRQGTYKSTFFRLLLPPELKDYFLSKTDAVRMDKDARLALSEFALICLEELATLTPRELDTIKGIITQTVISERAPYQRTKESRPHIASFCGTSNETELFGDRTGLRRWLAFEVTDILSPHTHPFNYRGIYSQAYYLWRNGFRYWFDADDIADLEPHMERFREVNLEQEQIARFFRVPSDERDSYGRYVETHTFVTVADILDRCSTSGMRGMLTKNNIGKAMRQMGFQQVRHNGLRGYVVFLLSEAEHITGTTLLP